MGEEKTLEEIIAETEAEFEQEGTESTEEETLLEPNAEESEEGEEVEETDVEESEEEVLEPNNEDIHKRNEAFKKLREERDAMSTSDKFVSELANQYGMSKEDLMARFREDQDKKLAKEQGLTDQQYKEMRELRERLAQVEESRQREAFNTRAASIASKYNLGEQQMLKLFSDAASMNIDITANPDLLEFVYRASNYENAINQGRQRQLEDSKKRRQTSNGSSGVRGKEPIINQEAQWDQEIEAIMKDLDLL